ncbi:GAF domain-containing protein [Salibacter halophilus]|nr:GAF domain-containing protein [Salibacter halophilus]
MTSKSSSKSDTAFTTGLKRQELLNFIAFPALLIDLNNRSIISLNREALDFYGFRENDIKGKSIDDFRFSRDTSGWNLSSTDVTFAHHQNADGKKVSVLEKWKKLSADSSIALLQLTDVSEQLLQDELLEKNRAFVDVLGCAIRNLSRSNQWEPQLQRLFKRIGQTLEVQSVYYYDIELNEEGSLSALKHEMWSKREVQDDISVIPIDIDTPFYQKLLSGNPFKADTDAINSTIIRELLTAYEVYSFLIYPIFRNSQLNGFLGIADCEKKRRWTLDEVRFLKSISRLLIGFIKVKRFDLIKNDQVERGEKNDQLELKGNIATSEMETHESILNRLNEVAWLQSHVVRPPLARIMGLVGLLQNKEVEVDQEKLLSEISKSAGELDRVINEVVRKSEN